MSDTPFRDTAQLVSRKMDYISMSVACNRARSHSWWRNVVEHGAWAGAGGARTGPPTPEAIPGIAKLFKTTEEQVSTMVAADWYGVQPDTEVSARVLRLAPALDRLKEPDATHIEAIVNSLAKAAPVERHIKRSS